MHRSHVPHVWRCYMTNASVVKSHQVYALDYDISRHWSRSFSANNNKSAKRSSWKEGDAAYAINSRLHNHTYKQVRLSPLVSPSNSRAVFIHIRCLLLQMDLCICSIIMHAMMVSEKPFVSAPLSRYAAFPKNVDFEKSPTSNRVTEPCAQLPTPSGHLSDFYTSPDSYLILPSNTMGKRKELESSDRKVVFARWLEFALRLVEMLGAIGLLFCAIVLQNVATYQIWILRIVVRISKL